MMSELKQTNGREVSFKEVFYEENMDSVPVETNKPSDEYAKNQLKIQEINQDYIRFFGNQNFLVENVSKLAVLLGLGLLTAAAMFVLLGRIESVPFVFSAGFSLFVVSSATILVSSGIRDFKTDKKAKEVQTARKLYRAKLIRSYFNGKIIGNINYDTNNWHEVSVLENGEINSYMVKIIKPADGLEFVQSKKIAK